MNDWVHCRVDFNSNIFAALRCICHYNLYMHNRWCPIYSLIMLQESCRIPRNFNKISMSTNCFFLSRYCILLIIIVLDKIFIITGRLVGFLDEWVHIENHKIFSPSFKVILSWYKCSSSKILIVNRIYEVLLKIFLDR